MPDEPISADAIPAKIAEAIALQRSAAMQAQQSANVAAQAQAEAATQERIARALASAIGIDNLDAAVDANTHGIGDALRAAMEPAPPPPSPPADEEFGGA